MLPSADLTTTPIFPRIAGMKTPTKLLVQASSLRRGESLATRPPTPSKKGTQSQSEGHEIPELPNQTGSGKAASIEVPSGNIGCSFYPDGTGGCGVKSYIAERKDRDAMGFAKWYFDLGNSSTEPQSKSDAPDWEVHSITAEYGNSYYYGDFQCESEETGLTCWNTATGQGVFMSREGYHTVQK